MEAVAEITNGDRYVLVLPQDEEGDVLGIRETLGGEERSVRPNHGAACRVESETQLLVKAQLVEIGAHHLMLCDNPCCRN